MTSNSAFGERRTRRIRFVRLLLSAAGGIGLLFALQVFVLARPFLALLAGEIDAGWKDVINTLEPRELPLILIGLFSEKATKHISTVLDFAPHLVTFAIGGALCWLYGKKTTELVYQHMFEEYDTRVLTRIRKPQPFDPLRGAVGVDPNAVALPFVNNGGSARFSAFESLVAFAGGKTERERGWWRPFPKPKAPFGWTVILGRSGTGKSRLAVEVARYIGLRGTDAVRGDDGRPSFASWLRVQVFCRPPGPNDPWDTGWLRPMVNDRIDERRDYDGYEEEVTLHTDRNWSKNLNDWRPARPTVLLLDDPRDADAEYIITILEANAEYFAHSVRLIIVNQTASEKLGLSRTAKGWIRKAKLYPMIQPIVLDDQAGKLDLSDLRWVLTQLDATGNRWASSLYETRALQRLLDSTGVSPC